MGAVLVHGDAIVAEAHNMVEQTGDPTAHAEMQCIRAGVMRLGGWRLATYATM